MAKIQLLFDEELLLLPEKPEIPACNVVDETEASFTAGAENGLDTSALGKILSKFLRIALSALNFLHSLTQLKLI